MNDFFTLVFQVLDEIQAFATITSDPDLGRRVRHIREAADTEFANQGANRVTLEHDNLRLQGTVPANIT